MSAGIAVRNRVRPSEITRISGGTSESHGPTASNTIMTGANVVRSSWDENANITFCAPPAAKDGSTKATTMGRLTEEIDFARLRYA